MSTLEERIRSGLEAEVTVSADDMLTAAAVGAARRRRQQRWTVGAGAAGVVAATVVAIAVVTMSGRSAGDQKPIDDPTQPVTPNADVQPSAADWFLELESDGTSVYLATRSCPRDPRDGHCETRAGELVGCCFTSGHQLGSSPVSLWRYDGRQWTQLGRVPDVSTPGLDPGDAFGAQLRVSPQGVVFVSTHGERGVRGPLAVSADGGESWETWELPWPSSRCANQECTVEIVGDYVVVASGATWMRRALGAADWEDITPPERQLFDIYDDGGYLLLALDDGTLVATASDIVPGVEGRYRVSRDFGSTWSALRDQPGVFDGTGGVEGSTLYSTCMEVTGTGSGTPCGFYKSTDLVHWELIPLAQGPEFACRPGYVQYESKVRVGSLTYALAHVPYLDGRPAGRDRLDHLDLPHDVRHVLKVSADGCESWEPVLD